MANDHVCPWWIIWTFDNPVRRLFHNPEKMLGPLVKSGDRVADIGCGIGFFSLGLARLVGESGRVYAMDLQKKMLNGVERRARQAGLSERIVAHQVEAANLAADNLAGILDLVLSFWMLHEVPDQAAFLQQVKALLKPGGLFYLAEPRMHVSSNDFDESLALAGNIGLQLKERPEVRLSRGALLAAE